MTMGGAALAARHEVSGADPTGSAQARVWVDYAPGSTKVGHQVDMRPAQPGAPDGGGSPTDSLGQYGSFVESLIDTLLPVSPDPEAWYVPAAEPPTVDAGPHLPDLAPLPAWSIYLDESIVGTTAGDFALATAAGEDPFGGSQRAIRFGATIANHGRHSLEVVGVPQPTGDEDHVRVDARQCVRFAGARVAGGERTCVEYKQVGSLVFHVQHGHFHIDGFAQYRLLKDAGGRPDERAVVSRSEKVGFCMGDTDWLGKGELVVDHGWYRECRHTAPNVPVTVRQGVSPQWGDSYGPGLPGQHLVIEGVPDGVYWVAITVNPPNVPGAVSLFETNRGNNTSYRKVQLLKGGTEVKVL
ncbi:MAG TPA: lysyl oxidase family protein [Egibacteraceae bacterium]|nr:lysyl oxidase family protein [Egibacteraceae bacterium]